MEHKLTGSKVGLWSGAHTGWGEGDEVQVEWVQGGSVVWGTHWAGGVMEHKLSGSKVGLWSGAHTGWGEGDGVQVEWVQGGSVVWGTHWVGGG